MTWLPKVVIGLIVPVAVRNASAASEIDAGALVRSAETVISVLTAELFASVYER